MYNLILRDLYLALYSSANFFYTSSFFILILVLLPFIFGTSIDQLQLLFKGILWIGLSLSIILTMERIFNTDYEDGNLDIILQKNSSLEIIVISKYISHWVVYCLPLFIILPLLSLLFYLNTSDVFAIFLNLLLGSFGMIFIATFVSALTLAAKRTIFLKAIIMIPLFVPFVIFGSGDNSWLILLALSMLSFVVSIYVSTYGLRLYGES